MAMLSEVIGLYSDQHRNNETGSNFVEGEGRVSWVQACGVEVHGWIRDSLLFPVED